MLGEAMGGHTPRGESRGLWVYCRRCEQRLKLRTTPDKGCPNQRCNGTDKDLTRVPAVRTAF